MELQALKDILRENGVVGAGGAGFPTYAKLDERADIIIMNCAECEPLLKLHRQLLEQRAEEIMQCLQMLAEVLSAESAIIAIKEEYHGAVAAVSARLSGFPKVRLHTLPNAYPMGDEQVLIKTVTGRTVLPGGLPIDVQTIVFNVETLYNAYRGVYQQIPTTDKLISVVGEVENPVTVRVPIGLSIGEVVALAGRVTAKSPVYCVGGPMMGSILSGDSPVTKTTNAVIVLNEDHPVIRSKNRQPGIDLKRAASACCQCQACTDLCPRCALGHPVNPHLFMRSASNQDFQQLNPFLNTLLCSGCGLCEAYACPQGLSPRRLMDSYKAGLRKNGVRPPKAPLQHVSPFAEMRRVSESRLAMRLKLVSYDTEAPIREQTILPKKLNILLQQHIGGAAKAVVAVGDRVMRHQKIAEGAEGLSVDIHSPAHGIIDEINGKAIVIRCEGDMRR